MSRWAAIGAVFVMLTALVGTGCSHKCGSAPGSCPDATFNLRVLDGSSVTWTFQGATTTNRLVPAPAPAGACSFLFEKGHLAPFGSANDAVLSGGYVDLRCNGGDAGTFDLEISALDDFRDWSTGTFTITPAAGKFSVDALRSGTGCTAASYPGIQLSVSVEAATGGAAPYPKMVTDDFVRTFRLDFDTTGISPTRYDSGEACDFPVVVGPVSLHLTQTAADYRYDANAACPCE